MTIRVVAIDADRRIVGLTKVLTPAPTVRVDPTTTSQPLDATPTTSSTASLLPPTTVAAIFPPRAR
jgi:hypothetical protein